MDEIVAALEFAYEHSVSRRGRSESVRAAWLIEHGRTWQSHANELKGWIL